MRVRSGTKKYERKKKHSQKVSWCVCFATRIHYTGLNFLAAFMAKTFALSA